MLLNKQKIQKTPRLHDRNTAITRYKNIFHTLTVMQPFI